MTDRFDELCKLNIDLDLKKVDIRTYSPLTLAYIGDAIYDLVIRTYIVATGNASNHDLHEKATRYVSARAQADIVDSILPVLSPEEMTIYKRGKNAKPHSGAKNASQGEYLKATGFEALLGYLYLNGESPRMQELIRLGIMKIREEKEA